MKNEINKIKQINNDLVEKSNRRENDLIDLRELEINNKNDKDKTISLLNGQKSIEN